MSTAAYELKMDRTLACCTRSLSLEKKYAIQDIFELAYTLYNIAERYQEIEIARIKLLWWQEELHLLINAQPRHPLTQHFQAGAHTFNISLTQVEALLQGSMQSLDIQSYDTQTQIEQHFSHTGGILLLLMGIICNHPQTLTAEEESSLIRAGVGLEIIRHMVDFPYLAARGHFYLPLQSLKAYSLSPFELTQKNHHTELQALLKEQAVRARTLTAEIMSTTTLNLRPLRQYIALQLALLNQIEQDHFQVLSHQWSLGQLKKYWVSWRTA